MYLLGSMTTLNWADSIGMFNSVYWSGHIAIFVWLALLFILPSPKRKPKLKPASMKED